MNKEIPTFKLREQTNRRIPDTFPPLPNPIDEPTIYQAAKSLRNAMAKIIWAAESGATDNDLLTVCDQTITIFWGPRDGLPSDEYKYLELRLLEEYGNPQRSLCLSKLSTKDRLTIGPDTRHKTVKELRIEKLVAEARLLHAYILEPDPEKKWTLAINAAIERLKKRLKITPKNEPRIREEVSQSLGLRW